MWTIPRSELRDFIIVIIEDASAWCKDFAIVAFHLYPYLLSEIITIRSLKLNPFSELISFSCVLSEQRMRILTSHTPKSWTFPSKSKISAWWKSSYKCALKCKLFFEKPFKLLARNCWTFLSNQQKTAILTFLTDQQQNVHTRKICSFFVFPKISLLWKKWWGNSWN